MTKWLAALMLAGTSAAGAAEHTAKAEADAAPVLLKLEANKPVELSCDTKSVVVKTNAANATNGELKLSIVLKDGSVTPGKGAWRIASVGEQHTASLGHREAKTCAESCPLTVAVDGNVELWSPSPKSIDKLADGEMLLLAVVKAKSLDLRASTFSGKEIESLEEGSCRVGS